jgi:hypothetical protein
VSASDNERPAPIERYAGLTALWARLVSQVLTRMDERLDTLDASMRSLRDEVHTMLREKDDEHAVDRRGR